MTTSPPAPRPTGLSRAEASSRLAADGPNELHPAPPTSALTVLLRQVANPMVAILAAAAVLSWILDEAIDAIAILAILLLNAGVGFFQEFRAEKAVHALRAMTAPRARVVRDGHATMIPAADVVVGDLLLLEAGDVVAADSRVVAAHALETNEAALTGESLPVGKHPGAAPADAPLAERHDHVFAGTAVSRGTGEALVVATGMRTEVGRIADLLSSADDEGTPLQHQLDGVAKRLIVICGAVVVLVAIIGLARGGELLEVLLGAVALAIAAVPEGLPAIVTIALAVGVQRLAQKRVLVRELPAVETLGACTVICTDKTGTLTTGRMVVREIWGPVPDEVVAAGVACVDAELGPDGGVGDPTEVAILLAGRERGLEREAIETDNPRLLVEPFDPETKRMAVRRADRRWYVKGAFERLRPLAVEVPDGIDDAVLGYARRGLRVLAVAVGDAEHVGELRLLGLLGLADPPRAEVIDAIAAARSGGIRTVMITGDHPVTARAIAEELGIVAPDEDGAAYVHARATPEDKLRIVRAWKDKGAIVAMTGDGVNDAPALREAHVGVAMGIAGTEVSREAADVVLTDDDFSAIVDGIREGRAIWANLRKTLVYLLAGNASELLLMLSAAVAGLPMPLMPLQLLWINLATDGLPALALVLDPPADDTLKTPPRDPAEPMLGRRQWGFVLLVGAIEVGAVMSVFVLNLDRGVDVARTLAFTALVSAELLRSLAARSEDLTFFEVGAFTNLRLIAVIVGSLVAQLLLLRVPEAAALLDVVVVPWSDVVIPVVVGLIPVTLLELAKVLRRRLGR